MMASYPDKLRKVHDYADELVNRNPVDFIYNSRYPAYN